MSKSWKIILGVSYVLLCLLINYLIGYCFPARVKFVIDGDTVVLEDGTKLRYIGVDTPDLKPGEEIESFAQKAYEANKELVEGKNVWLELDVQKFDKYNRLLAYVFVGSIFVNGWLVENGYARAACYPPNVKYYHYFRHLEKILESETESEAEVLDLEIKCEDTEIFLGNKRSKKFHLPTCKYGNMIQPENLVIFKSREEVLAAGFQPCKWCDP